MDRQGEKIDARLGRLGGDHGRQHSRLAPAREYRAVGLTGDAARFQHEVATAPIEFFTLNIEHLSSSFSRW
jgi:hypothetical protein